MLGRPRVKAETDRPPPQLGFLNTPRLSPLGGPGWLGQSLVSLLDLGKAFSNPAEPSRPTPIPAHSTLQLLYQFNRAFQRCLGLYPACLCSLVGFSGSVFCSLAGNRSDSMELGGGLMVKDPCSGVGQAPF